MLLYLIIIVIVSETKKLDAFKWNREQKKKENINNFVFKTIKSYIIIWLQFDIIIKILNEDSIFQL